MCGAYAQKCDAAMAQRIEMFYRQSRSGHFFDVDAIRSRVVFVVEKYRQVVQSMQRTTDSLQNCHFGQFFSVINNLNQAPVPSVRSMDAAGASLPLAG